MVKIKEEDFRQMLENNEILLSFLENSRPILGTVVEPAIELAKKVQEILNNYNN